MISRQAESGQSGPALNVGPLLSFCGLFGILAAVVH
jgi:hypothetical protein